jgi:hypothetical protein
LQEYGARSQRGLQQSAFTPHVSPACPHPPSPDDVASPAPIVASDEVVPVSLASSTAVPLSTVVPASPDGAPSPLDAPESCAVEASLELLPPELVLEHAAIMSAKPIKPRRMMFLPSKEVARIRGRQPPFAPLMPWSGSTSANFTLVASR